jgi:hypothetical protein
MPGLDSSASLEVRARQLRQVLTDWYSSESRAGPQQAKLHLLGLTPAAYASTRADRRVLAAAAVGSPVDTFIRRDEGLLLADVADDIWAACSMNQGAPT